MELLNFKQVHDIIYNLYFGSSLSKQSTAH